ncbi:MAG: membrane protein insertion efficiency factor YidD [Candidatus Omnitrophota bacterium]|nr:MAG: membrane protein insertion efficiency factor YidD [Candidatus Omnitrophota bacterium]
MRHTIIFFIDLYQNYISCLKTKSCKFYPTCSMYAKQAIIKKGVLKGIMMSLWRIIRCNPLSAGGYDPVE